MRVHAVREEDSLNAMSAEYALPCCMLLRANGLFTSAWLFPGREIEIPSSDYCAGRPGSICPVLALRLGAWPSELRRLPSLPPEAVASAAALGGLPQRLYLLARERELYLPEDVETITVRYGDDWQELCRRCKTPIVVLQRLNRYWGPLLPGMRLILPAVSAQ